MLISVCAFIANTSLNTEVIQVSNQI
jgi:hypothetical protein